jgi:phosphotransferase system HPr (HPr) family protein
MKVIEKDVVIGVQPGLQARPAAIFVQKANNYASEIFIEKGTKRINAKSIMGLMSLALANGTEIKLIADGPDDEDALRDLIEFVENDQQ